MNMDNDTSSDEKSFEELLNSHEKKQTSKRVTGKIVQINNDFALVDIGHKSEGRLNIDELKENGEIIYKVGDDIEVMITGSRGERVNISRKEVLKFKAIDEFIKKHNGVYDKLVVNGKVTRFSKSGFNVVGEDGCEYFMPLSQSFLKADNTSVGRSITAYVLDADKDRGSIVISRKKYIQEQQEKSQVLIEEWQKTNEPREAKVTSVIRAGVFVDINGISGMVPYNEISHRGGVNPMNQFKEGDSVNVVIKEYTKSNGRLNLSIKDTMKDPWEELKEGRLFQKGDTVSARICNLEKFGAFVSLPGGLEALLHVSQISWSSKFLEHPSEVLSVGEDINVKIIEIDKEKKQIQVSLKALGKKPFDSFKEAHKVGDVIKGKIVSIKDFGAFVNLGSVDGLLHNDNLSWENKKCSDELKVGDEIEVKVSRIDNENEKVWLSKKALEASPLDDFAKDHKVNDIITKKIIQIKDFGVFVEVKKGLDALIRTEDLSVDISELKVGDELEAAIVSIDFNRGQIRLSCKKVDYIHEKEALGKLNAQNDNANNTLGDLLKDSFKDL